MVILLGGVKKEKRLAREKREEAETILKRKKGHAEDMCKEE